MSNTETASNGTPERPLGPGTSPSAGNAAGTSSAPDGTPERLLGQLGLSSFRPGQREAVQAALAGRDSLVVMPTGAGKSLCYQLPALADSAQADSDSAACPLVLVVSPLIALMADQLRSLRRAGVRAVMLASSLDPQEAAAALRDIRDGAAQLALVAPERFASRAFTEAVAEREIALFAVDEAHCVAEWGHDFRPDYLRLRDAISSLRRPSRLACPGAPARPPVMATTATATPRVAREIAKRLGLSDWVSVSSGFDRPNLAFDVVAFEGKGSVARKRAALQHVLCRAGALPAIVYCGTRRDTEAVAEQLAEWGLGATAYHAGMTAERRGDAQEAFMSGRGADVIVATNAFGMGVDKADVRTVVHWAIPTSLEAYYQEAGRAGRDGAPARALLLASRVDLGRLIRFNAERNIDVEEVRAFTARLRSLARAAAGDGYGLGPDPGTGADPASAADSASASGASAEMVESVEIGRGEMSDKDRQLLSIAERAGAAVLRPGQGGGLEVQLTGRGSPRAAHQAIKAAKDRGWEAYRSIERFVSNASTCRRRQILAHFGDGGGGAAEGRCCDVCDPDAELLAVAATEVRARTSSRRAAGWAARADGAAGARGVGGGALSAGSPGAAGQEAERGLGLGPGFEAEPEPEPVDREQMDALRRWRLERADGKPAYTVAHNAALEEVLRRQPQTARELAQISGIGPVFLERHGESLLEELRGLL